MKIKVQRSDGATFDSIALASLSVDADESTIRKALDTDRLAKGFKWTTIGDSSDPVTIGDLSNTDDSLPLSVVDNAYTWKSNGIYFNLPIDVADSLFFDYSKYGKNLTALQVRVENNISLKQWHSLKGRLQLYKESDIFSPETRKNMTPSEYKELCDTKVKELDLFKKRAIVESYNQYQIKQAHKWRDEANRKTFAHESIISELSDWLDGRHSDFTIACNPKAKGGTLVVAIADIHYGADVPREYNNPEFNRRVLDCIVGDLADRINEQEAERVVLMLLGDYIETFSGLNHINSWQSIESGMFGAMVARMFIEDFMEKLIYKIANVSDIYATFGNHDRSSASNKEDVKGQIAEMIFYTLERLYGGKINFKCNSYVLTDVIDGVKYILLHGHTPSDKKSESLVSDYGDSRMFNLVLSGHIHSRGKSLDAFNRRHIKVPPIFSGNYYSSQLGFSSVSGALLIRSENGLPQVTDLSLYSKLL